MAIHMAAGAGKYALIQAPALDEGVLSRADSCGAPPSLPAWGTAAPIFQHQTRGIICDACGLAPDFAWIRLKSSHGVFA